jgi:DNA-binding NtrC family response regulator
MAEREKGRVLIVEDDVDMAALLRSTLGLEGYRTETAADIRSACQLLASFSFDAILLDLNLGAENGLELITHITRVSPFAKIIVMTAFGSIDLAVDALEKGATTFITKSDGPENIVRELNNRLFERFPLRIDNALALAKTIGIVGTSEPICKILKQIDQIKDVDATVLLLGESGTGKELIARGIHLLSGRQDKPFEAINCGAIPENLLESELFGYKKGAFTDAKTDHKGMFEICTEGTIFLDEIGEMPMPLQVKILRVLQEREVRPIGSTVTVSINSRVICATNRDLVEEIEASKFRQDLYFRLSVIPIALPPLRERAEDIPLLVEFFIHKFNERYKRNINRPKKELMARILAYDWPGNVRELQNSIERGVIMAPNSEIEGDTLFVAKSSSSPKHLRESLSISSTIYSEAKEQFEKTYLRKILALAKGNVSEAARISGRFRSDIYRLLERYNIDQSEFR